MVNSEKTVATAVIVFRINHAIIRLENVQVDVVPDGEILPVPNVSC